MLFDPTERNIYPFLFPARIRAMKELIPTLAIHDKDVTMAETAQVGFIPQTGLALPSEDCRVAKTHRNDGSSLQCHPTRADKGSGSHQLAALPQHTMASSGVR